MTDHFMSHPDASIGGISEQVYTVSLRGSDISGLSTGNQKNNRKVTEWQLNMNGNKIVTFRREWSLEQV